MGLHKYYVIGSKNRIVGMEKLLSNQNAVSKHIKDAIEKEVNDIDDGYIRVDRHDNHWGIIGWTEWMNGTREPKKWRQTFELYQSIHNPNSKKVEDDEEGKEQT